MHPDDKSPYQTREQLFETIRQQREEISRLKGEHIELPSESHRGMQPVPRHA